MEKLVSEGAQGLVFLTFLKKVSGEKLPVALFAE